MDNFANWYMEHILEFASIELILLLKNPTFMGGYKGVYFQIKTRLYVAAQRFALLADGRARTILIIVGNAEARKMPKNGDESHQSSARFVGTLFFLRT